MCIYIYIYIYYSCCFVFDVLMLCVLFVVFARQGRMAAPGGAVRLFKLTSPEVRSFPTSYGRKINGCARASPFFACFALLLNDCHFLVICMSLSCVFIQLLCFVGIPFLRSGR